MTLNPRLPVFWRPLFYRLLIFFCVLLDSSYPLLPPAGRLSLYLLSSSVPSPLHIPASLYPQLFVSQPASGGICWCRSPWGGIWGGVDLEPFCRCCGGILLSLVGAGLQPLTRDASERHLGNGGACLLALRGAWHGSPQAPKASSVNRRESTLGWSSERLPMCLSKCLSVLLLELQADVLIGGRSHFWVVIGE